MRSTRESAGTVSLGLRCTGRTIEISKNFRTHNPDAEAVLMGIYQCADREAFAALRRDPAFDAAVAALLRDWSGDAPWLSVAPAQCEQGASVQAASGQAASGHGAVGQRVSEGVARDEQGSRRDTPPARFAFRQSIATPGTAAQSRSAAEAFGLPLTSPPTDAELVQVRAVLKEAQQHLAAIGYLGLSEATGQWNGKTAAALSRFRIDFDVESSPAELLLALEVASKGPNLGVITELQVRERVRRAFCDYLNVHLELERRRRAGEAPAQAEYLANLRARLATLVVGLHEGPFYTRSQSAQLLISEIADYRLHHRPAEQDGAGAG